jgi:hypothetical protein
MYTDAEPLFTGRAGAASFTGVVMATAVTVGTAGCVGCAPGAVMPAQDRTTRPAAARRRLIIFLFRPRALA